MNIESKVKEKKSLRFDIIIIALLLVISALFLLLTLVRRTDGSTVDVEIRGEVVAKYNLAQNGEYSLNGGTNILVIENGEAYLSYADCPDHTCVRTGKIKYVGQSIVCLPNKVTMTVRGNSEGVDFVS